MLFAEMEELAGQRNAIDSRLVEIAAEIEGDGIWGATGCRSVPALVAWKLGVSPHNAETIVTAARRTRRDCQVLAAGFMSKGCTDFRG